MMTVKEEIHVRFRSWNYTFRSVGLSRPEPSNLISWRRGFRRYMIKFLGTFASTIEIYRLLNRLDHHVEILCLCLRRGIATEKSLICAAEKGSYVGGIWSL